MLRLSFPSLLVVEVWQLYEKGLSSIFEVKVILSDRRAGAILCVLSFVLSPEVPEPLLQHLKSSLLLRPDSFLLHFLVPIRSAWGVDGVLYRRRERAVARGPTWSS